MRILYAITREHNRHSFSGAKIKSAGDDFPAIRGLIY
jgi:hypothetical protein